MRNDKDEFSRVGCQVLSCCGTLDDHSTAQPLRPHGVVDRPHSLAMFFPPTFKKGPSLWLEGTTHEGGSLAWTRTTAGPTSSKPKVYVLPIGIIDGIQQ